MGMSVVSPPSRCPSCESSIRWFQNIPILSWLLLRGRCAVCKQPIACRYPFVEALNGLLFVLAFFRFGFTSEAIVYAILSSLLLVVTFIDLDHRIIPNVISLPGVIAGFVCALFFLPTITWQDSLFGILLGGGLLWGVAFGYKLLTGVDGMGMGDVKLLAMIGAFLGWKLVLPTIFLGSLAGTVVGVPLMFYRRAGRRLALPFGPFLSFGALLALYAWPQIFSWYVATFLTFR